MFVFVCVCVWKYIWSVGYRVAEERSRAPESIIGYQNLAELVQVCQPDMCVCLCLCVFVCVCVCGSRFGVLGTG